MNGGILNPVSLVVRVAVSTTNVERIARLHNDVAAKHGSVWFGILGRAPSMLRCAAFGEQIKTGVSTYLYLLQRSKNEFVGFRAAILRISPSPPNDGAAPSYYEEQDITKKAILWVNVRAFKAFESTLLHSLRVESTQRPLEEALSRGMASVLIVS